MRYVQRIVSSLCVGVLAFSLAMPAPKTQAALAGNWQAGNIIDDGIFYNGNDWSAQQIQQFLNNLVTNCDTWGTQASEYGSGTRAQYGASAGYPAPYVCLKNYYENPTTHENNLTVTAGQLAPVPAGAMSAADIIKSAATTYGVSVRALLVILYKESIGPLLSDSWPFPNQYRNPMGFGCPDTAPCNPTYAGFYNQMHNAARQFSLYKSNPTGYRHVAQRDNAVLYNPVSSCGSSQVFIKTNATAGLYNYTPYQPNAAALNNLYGSGDSCSAYGNRNFWRIFTDWFGNPLLPTAYKTPASATVYIQLAGYKFAVPSMAMLQDYGVSPTNIGTISQDLSDTIPTPPPNTNLSDSLGYLIKTNSDVDSDGPTLYLVSLGRKYPIPSISIVSDYGLSVSDIRYLPATFIQTLPTDSLATNFIRLPNGSLFQMASGQKHLIFDSAKYTSLSQGSYAIPVSDAIASFATSSDPLSTNPVVLKSSTSNAVYAYNNGSYFAFPDLDTMQCWGVNTRAELSLNVIDEKYLPPSISTAGVLSCLSKETTDTAYLFSRTIKYTVPNSYGYSISASLPSQLSYLYMLLPTASQPLKQAVRASGPAVWYLEGGTKKAIPTYSNLTLLGLSSNYALLDDSSIAVLGQQGIKLGTGQAVKTPGYGAIYIINGNKRIAVPDAEIFTGYRFSWQNIETYDPAVLDTYYPIESDKTLLTFYTDPHSLATYAIGPKECYAIPSQNMSDFGQNPTSNSTAQTYTINAFPNLNLSGCMVASTFMKSPGSAVVYRLSGGVKYPVSSWAKLLSLNGGVVPNITVLSTQTVNGYPVGATL